MPQTEQGNTETQPQPVLWQGYRKKKILILEKHYPINLKDMHLKKIPMIKQAKGKKGFFNLKKKHNKIKNTTIVHYNSTLRP